MFLKRILAAIYNVLHGASQSVAYADFQKKYKIDPSFRFNGNNILFYGDGEIVIGAGSYIGEYSTLQSAKGNSIRIGKNCAISHNVRFYTQSSVADHDFANTPVPSKFGSIVVEDNVWIGANVFINPGITIGRNSVVGANSVVTKDVPENAIVGGVPAKLIRLKT